MNKPIIINIIIIIIIIITIIIIKTVKCMAAMLVYQANPVGFELFSYVNTFFCSN